MNEDCKHDRQVVTCQICGRVLREVVESNALDRLFGRMFLGVIAIGIVASLPLTLPLVTIGWVVDTLVRLVIPKRRPDHAPARSPTPNP